MDKGVLFLAHSTEPKPRIIVGVQGSGVHTAFLPPEEALRFAYQVIETVERMERMDRNKRPEDHDGDEE